MEYKKQYARVKTYTKTFLKWLMLSVFLGVVCGIIGVAFHHAIEIATHFRSINKWAILLAPFAGVIIVFIYKKSNMEHNRGTNAIFNSVRNAENVKTRLTALVFISTTLTHLVGGSSGREGAALQMGGSIGATLARFLKLSENEFKTIVICGMSGVFSALFQTPLTATIFCIEVVNIGLFNLSAFMPALVSALTAHVVALSLGSKSVFYLLANAPISFDVIIAAKVMALSILCGSISMLLCMVLHIIANLYKKYLPNPYIRIMVGGAIIALLTIIEGSGDYNGAGMLLAERAISGAKIVPWAFLLKLLFTAVTLGAGFKGGEIVPTLCIGATFGSVMGAILGLDPAFAAALGLVAVFCGATNTPIASIFLSIEFFGSGNILYFALACAISYLLSGRYSLYSAQKFVYSKLEPTLLDDMLARRI